MARSTVEHARPARKPFAADRFGDVRVGSSPVAGPHPSGVIRRGCTPAFPGQAGFDGATMGEPSVILRGTGVHFGSRGFGRTMSKRRGRVETGEIDFEDVRRTLIGAGIELRGGAADEAPAAYKRLDAVLAAHGDTIEILHRLTPIGVAMAAPATFDPYKDQLT